MRAAASPADASLGDLVRNMSADLSRLVRNEMQLAQTEITENSSTPALAALVGKKQLNQAAPRCPSGPWPA